MKKKHKLYYCHNQTILILGLNHSHRGHCLHTKQKGEAEEMTKTRTTTYFILQKAEPLALFSNRCQVHSKTPLGLHTHFELSFCIVTASSRVLCDKGSIVFCDWSNTIREAQGTQPSLVTQLSWESAGAVVTS